MCKGPGKKASKSFVPKKNTLAIPLPHRGLWSLFSKAFNLLLLLLGSGICRSFLCLSQQKPKLFITMFHPTILRQVETSICRYTGANRYPDLHLGKFVFELLYLPTVRHSHFMLGIARFDRFKIPWGDRWAATSQHDDLTPGISRSNLSSPWKIQHVFTELKCAGSITSLSHRCFFPYLLPNKNAKLQSPLKLGSSQNSPAAWPTSLLRSSCSCATWSISLMIWWFPWCLSSPCSFTGCFKSHIKRTGVALYKEILAPCIILKIKVCPLDKMISPFFPRTKPESSLSHRNNLSTTWVVIGPLISRLLSSSIFAAQHTSIEKVRNPDTT